MSTRPPTAASLPELAVTLRSTTTEAEARAVLSGIRQTVANTGAAAPRRTHYEIDVRSPRLSDAGAWQRELWDEFGPPGQREMMAMWCHRVMAVDVALSDTAVAGRCERVDVLCLDESERLPAVMQVLKDETQPLVDWPLHRRPRCSTVNHAARLRLRYARTEVRAYVLKFGPTYYRTFHSCTPADHPLCIVTSRRSADVSMGVNLTRL